MLAGRAAPSPMPTSSGNRSSGGETTRHLGILFDDRVSPQRYGMLRENDFLSDLRVRSGHRVQLASHSGYFRFIFSSGMADAFSPCLALPEADAADFVAFVYIGEFTLNRSLVPSLAQVSAFLDAPDFQSAVAMELSKDVRARW